MSSRSDPTLSLSAEPRSREGIVENKFNEAGGFDKSFRELACSIRSQELQLVIESYKQNMERVVSHWEFPVHMFGLGQTVQFFLSTTTSHPSGSYPAPSYREHLELLGIRGELESSAEILTQMQVSLASTELDRLFVGIDSILSSMLVETWTCVDVLAEDLWESAINLHPDCLIESLSRPDKDAAKKLKLTLDTELFRQYGYSLAGRLGSFLKSEFSFARFERIRDAYSSGFEGYITVFDTNKNRSLFELAQTRNAIVHNSVKADEEFIKKMVEIDKPLPEFAGLEPNKKIPIDGRLVRELIGRSVTTMNQLVREIDAWLSLKLAR